MYKQSLSLLATILFLGASQAQAILIDDFNHDAAFVDSGSPGPTTFPVSAGAIGGFRTLEILDGSQGASLEVAPSFDTGILAHSQNARFAGSSRVTWDANGNGLGGADLTENGLTDAIQLDIRSIDVGEVTLTFTVTSGTESAELTLAGLGEGQFAFPFTDFSGSQSVFSSADAISLTVEAGVSSDLTLDLIQTRQGTDVGGAVPEPGTLFMVGTGLASLGLIISRRRRHC